MARPRIALWLAFGVAMASCLARADNGPMPDKPDRKAFRAAAHAIDVSPRKFPIRISGGFLEARADRLHDPLHARCLVLDDGTTRLAIAIVDTLMMPRDLLDAAKQAAHKATGIPVEHMLIAATHTHSAPAAMGALGTDAEAEYAAYLPGRIAEGIEAAAKNLAPARVGWAVAKDPEHTHCRRWILRPDRIGTDPFGGRTVRAMMHPGYQSPNHVGPAGPADDDVPVLSIQSPDGRPIALLANYSQHYCGAPPVSADYFGVFAEKIGPMVSAEKAQPPFVGILSQGTSGDLHWMDYSRKPKPGLNRVTIAEALARIVCEACKAIRHHDWVPLAMAERKLTLRRRVPDAERLAWARKIVAEMQQRPPRNQREVYAREQVFLHEEPQVELKLQAVRIGQLGIAAIPAEVFGITGLKIKAHSPLKPTFNVELANGAEGYIPPPEQHKLGGYTTWPARTAGLEVQAEPRIVETVLQLLEQVAGRPRRTPTDVHGPYARAVLASKPAAYWRFGEFHGPRAHDATGHGNHGTYEDGVVFYLEGPAGPHFSGEGGVNRAAHFAGGRMKAVVPDLAAACTVELWFRNGLPNDARAVTGYILSRAADGARGGSGERLGLGGTRPAAAQGKLLFLSAGRPDEVLVGRTTVECRTWQHVALVRDGRNVTVYLNGGTKPEISGQAEPGPAKGADQWLIGGASDNSYSFEGKLDEVAVYGRALPGEEVARHYAAASPSASRPGSRSQRP
jgi:hypothetical protein